MANKYYFWKIRAFHPRSHHVINFKVRGTSHRQHIYGETYIEGLAESALQKIRDLKERGYRISTSDVPGGAKILNR
jgi:hypothetical protein